MIAGGTIAVVGSGASAITTLHMLRQRCEKSGGTAQVVWITRRAGAPYELIENDPLPQRAELHKLGNELAAAAADPAGAGFQVDHRGGCHVVSLERTEDDGVVIELELSDGGERTTVAAASVVAHVGYRPDASLTSELQVHYCYATEGPMKLAGAMMAAGGGGGDCLAQVSPGPATVSAHARPTAT